MKEMYTFRFNPIFRVWVLVGAPVPQTLAIRDGHLLTTGHALAPDLRVAVLPRQPFILEPKSKQKPDSDLLYTPQQPVGEYELLLYTGETAFLHWQSSDWEQWLILMADRIQQLHLNPYLNFVTLSLSTKLLSSVGEGYQRVGDLIAASHPLAGMSTPLPKEMAAKILAKEQLFVVREDQGGSFYVPSAPTHSHEVWYIPHSGTLGVEVISQNQRLELAQSLAELFAVLHEEFHKAHWQMTIHTAMAGNEHDDTWWIQICQDDSDCGSGLAVQESPERFVFTMKHLLAHRGVIR